MSNTKREPQSHTNKMSNFYVGQKVVCIRSIYNGEPSVGQVFAVTGLYHNCKCGPCITVGLMDHGKEHPFDKCDGCGEWCKTETPEWEMSSDYFRPIDSLTEQIERIEEEGAPIELEPDYA